MDSDMERILQQNILSLMFAGQFKACIQCCIQKPSTDLTASEKQCLAMCQDRYAEVFQKTFASQYTKFQQGLQAAEAEQYNN